jgi:hypothetical protein
MKYIDTERQLADIFTKPVDVTHFASLQGGSWCLPSLWLGLRGACVLPCIYSIMYPFAFMLHFLHIHLSQHCFTSLYLVGYAYHCARVSGNEI